MALNGDQLGQEIVNTIDLSGLNQTEKDKLLASWKLIASAIVDHIKANAEFDGAKLETTLNSIFSGGIPIPNDGGATLQVAWGNATSANNDTVTGGIK